MSVRAIHLDSYDAEAHEAYARFLRLLALTLQDEDEREATLGAAKLLQDDYYQWQLSTETRVATTGAGSGTSSRKPPSDASPSSARARGVEQPSDPTPIDTYSRRVPCS